MATTSHITPTIITVSPSYTGSVLGGHHLSIFRYFLHGASFTILVNLVSQSEDEYEVSRTVAYNQDSWNHLPNEKEDQQIMT